MSLGPVERIARALLYEGYMLYPYRPSSVKNQQRFNFGVVYPEAWVDGSGGADSSLMQTECLVTGSEGTLIGLGIRFLHLESRTIMALAPGAVLSDEADRRDLLEVGRLEVNDRVHVPWQEAIEREIRLDPSTLGDLSREPRRLSVTLPESERTESLRDARGRTVGAIVRRQRVIAAEVELSAVRCGDRTFRVRARVVNSTSIPPDHGGGRAHALLHSLVSTHTILSASGGEFISCFDPPDSLRGEVAACRSIGTWPVLVGDRARADTLLSSPIILYDYPEVAPESAGDLFDSTEIDEILSLRILTLTDDEQREMRQIDDRSRLLLERTQTLAADQLAAMHGALRESGTSLQESR